MPSGPRAAGCQQATVQSLRVSIEQLAVRAFKAFSDARKVAAVHGISVKTLQRWVAKEARGAPMGHAPRSGRPPKLDAAAKAVLRRAGAQIATGSAASAAAALRGSTGISICKSTAWCYLTTEGHAFRVVRKAPRLTAPHKADRLLFAAGHNKTMWSKVMFTDSKYFKLTSDSGRVGHYTMSSAPPTTRELVKHSPALHVYMGVTIFGLTRMVVVTGGSTKNTDYYNKAGTFLLRGVGAQEYAKVVLPMFEAEGRLLFDKQHRRSWMLQQDGAKIHWGDVAKARSATVAPGGLLHKWPACSPDLSLIENVWAMMAHELRVRPPCASPAELLNTLEEVRLSLTAERLAPLFASMPHRLQDCLDMGGAIVRF